MISRLKRNPGYAAVIGLIFICLMAFYAAAHPFYPWTRDDWWQINFMRLPIPTHLEYNPTKILPETVLPLTAYLSVWFVYPLTHDYLGALSLGFAFTLSLFALLYVVSFGWLVRKTLSVKSELLSFMTVSFTLFHFLVFGRKGDGVSTLCLWGSDYLNNVFNYILPAFANLALSLFILTDRDRKRFSRMSMTGRSLFVLAVYLCINSNIFQSVILMSALFSQSLIYIISEGKDLNLRKIMKARAMDLIILAVFLGAAFMEITGSRADSFSGSSLSETLSWFLKAIREQWILFPAISLFLILCSLVLFSLRMKKGEGRGEDRIFIRVLAELFIMTIMTGLCDILICTRVRADYIYGHKVMIGVISCTAVMAMYSAAYLFMNIKNLTYVMPLLLYVLIYMTALDDRVYVDYNGKVSETEVREFDEYMIAQYEEADKAGAESFTLVLPENNPVDKAGGNGGNSIANTLYRHGVISRKPEVSIEPE